MHDSGAAPGPGNSGRAHKPTTNYNLYEDKHDHNDKHIFNSQPPQSLSVGALGMPAESEPCWVSLNAGSARELIESTRENGTPVACNAWKCDHHVGQ